MIAARNYLVNRAVPNSRPVLIAWTGIALRARHNHHAHRPINWMTTRKSGIATRAGQARPNPMMMTGRNDLNGLVVLIAPRPLAQTVIARAQLIRNAGR